MELNKCPSGYIKLQRREEKPMEETIKIQRTETEENRKQRYCDYERALKQLRKMKQQEEKQHAI